MKIYCRILLSELRSLEIILRHGKLPSKGARNEDNVCQAGLVAQRPFQRSEGMVCHSWAKKRSQLRDDNGFHR